MKLSQFELENATVLSFCGLGFVCLRFVWLCCCSGLRVFIAGRIWAGYGILEFRLSKDKRSIFSEIRRNPPEPKRTIDLLGLLTQRFGSRAGDMKLETLAAYFGLGNQTHESGLCQDECRGSQVMCHCLVLGVKSFK